MNNTLDINRLGKVVKHDAMSFAQNLGLTLVILWAIPVVMWLFSSLTPSHAHIDTFSRVSIIRTLGTILLIIAPAGLYKYCNDQRKGIGYAMMPASSLEKFISMVFYCVIVAPIIYLAGALAVDSILALLGEPYEGFAIADYFDKYEQLRNVGVNSGLMFDTDVPGYDTKVAPVYNEYAKILSPAFLITVNILSTLMLSSIFMFGNMVFKKRKTGKMIGILILLFIVFMIIMVNFVANHEDWFERHFGNMTKENAVEFFKHMIYIISRTAMILSAIVSAVMLWLTYYKIKTQKY